MTRERNRLWLACIGGILLLLYSGGGQLLAVSENPRQIYRLSTGDLIRVDVIHEPDLRIEQKLDPTGEVSIPLLGSVALSGYSIREAESILEKEFREQELLVDPQVSVSVIQYAEQIFYIFGEVSNPGVKQMPPGKDTISVLEAISIGGELTRYARRNGVKIQSKGGGIDSKTITVDLDALLRGEADLESSRFQVKTGDIVFVPERLF